MSVSIEENVSFVEIRKEDDVYVLYRNGKPFFVKGACGYENLDRLVACGANSLRTWGSDQTIPILGDLRRLGLTFCAGLWMEPARRGFDYHDPALVGRQEKRLLAEVDQIMSEPGLLMWGVGNELDLGSDDLAAWDAVESIARSIKRRDASHPVITVIASPTERTLRAVEERCPSLDALGVNSYADMSKLIPALDAVGWNRPYFVTEWGSDGSWEVGKAPWGAPLEPTSADKARQMAERYGMIVSDRRRCLGSYAFFWGNKQETTPTWFNLFDPDGGEYEAVEALTQIWSNREVSRFSGPSIRCIDVLGTTPFAKAVAGERVEASVSFEHPPEDGTRVDWHLLPESVVATVGGDPEEPLSETQVAFTTVGLGKARFRLPDRSGAYRVFAYATDSEGRRSTANVPILVLDR